MSHVSCSSQAVHFLSYLDLAMLAPALQAPLRPAYALPAVAPAVVAGTAAVVCVLLLVAYFSFPLSRVLRRAPSLLITLLIYVAMIGKSDFGRWATTVVRDIIWSLQRSFIVCVSCKHFRASSMKRGLLTGMNSTLMLQSLKDEKVC